MNLKRLILLLLIIITINSYSQYATFEYWTDLCDCKAKFDSIRFKREQLQNTIDYLWRAPNINTTATAWTLDEINELSLGDLNKECAERINNLITIDIVDDEFWSNLTEEIIKYYESTCRLRGLTISAYSNPDTLLDYELVDSISIYYRDALKAGGEKLVDAWINLNEAQKRLNVNPVKVQQKFDEKYNSDLRFEYARLEVMQFGWWNSANKLLPHVKSYNYNEEFERLLFDVRCECDEP